MEQQQVFQRPPAEADSFIIKVMDGCSHNKCTFCGSFKDIPFRPWPLDEVLRGIENDAQNLGPRFLPFVKGLYLEGGNPMVLPTAHLTRIISHAKAFFPALGHVACYSTVADIRRKSWEEMAVLAEAGLTRVYVGVESGCDAILEAVHKGCTTKDMILAADKLRKVGIENDVSIMVGIGGREFSERNAIDTGEILNATQPYCVRVRTYVPYFHTQLGEDYMHGRFSLLNAHEALRELRLLVQTIREETFFLSEHWSNFAHFAAPLPAAKEKLLAGIDEALAKPLESFRPAGITECSTLADTRDFYVFSQNPDAAVS